MMRTLVAVLFCCSLSTCIAQPSGQRADWLSTIKTNAVAAVQGKQAFSSAPSGPALYFVRNSGVDAPYIVFVPASYNPSKPMQVVVFLHGAILARDSFQYSDPGIAREPVFSVADTLQTLVVFPFGRTGFMWPVVEAANENIMSIIGDVAQHYNIDKQRIFLGGISMGGMATFWFVTHKYDAFAGFYTFSAMPPESGVRYSNLGVNKPLISLHAKDDPGFPFDEVLSRYNAHKMEAPGWSLSAVSTGGHRFIYAPGGDAYVKATLSRLLQLKSR